MHLSFERLFLACRTDAQWVIRQIRTSAKLASNAIITLIQRDHTGEQIIRGKHFHSAKRFQLPLYAD